MQMQTVHIHEKSTNRTHDNKTTTTGPKQFKQLLETLPMDWNCGALLTICL